MRIINKLNNMRVGIIFIIEISIISSIGIINMLINKEQVFATISGIIGGDKFVPTIAIVGVVASAILLQAATIIALALVSYFIAAAIGKGADIKYFGGVAVRGTFFSFLLMLSDMFGFLFTGNRFIECGSLGLVSYIPFYCSVFILFYCLVDRRINFSRKKKLVVSLACAVASIFVTYPL